jgi:hypothetical protein
MAFGAIHRNPRRSRENGCDILTASKQRPRCDRWRSGRIAKRSFGRQKLRHDRIIARSERHAAGRCAGARRPCLVAASRRRVVSRNLAGFVGGGRQGRRHDDFVPARGWPKLAMASHRCGRDLDLAGRLSVAPRNCRRAWARANPPGPGSGAARSSAGCRSRACMAGSGESRPVVARSLRGRAGVRICRFRTRAGGLETITRTLRRSDAFVDAERLLEQNHGLGIEFGGIVGSMTPSVARRRSPERHRRETFQTIDQIG